MIILRRLQQESHVMGKKNAVFCRSGKSFGQRSNKSVGVGGDREKDSTALYPVISPKLRVVRLTSIL